MRDNDVRYQTLKEKVFQFTQCELNMSCITHSRNTYFFLSFYDLLLQFTVTDNPLVYYCCLLGTDAGCLDVQGT
jgi:predicted membrane-bound mannosyltransferase